MESNFQDIAKSILLEKRSEFCDYKKNKQKLDAIKALKEYTSGGLKECKAAIDLYFDDPTYFLVHDRKEKLKELAKIPVIDAMIVNIQKTTSETWKCVLSSFELDELLNLDEKLTIANDLNNNESK